MAGRSFWFVGAGMRDVGGREVRVAYRHRLFLAGEKAPPAFASQNRKSSPARICFAKSEKIAAPYGGRTTDGRPYKWDWAGGYGIRPYGVRSVSVDILFFKIFEGSARGTFAKVPLVCLWIADLRFTSARRPGAPLRAWGAILRRRSRGCPCGGCRR